MAEIDPVILELRAELGKYRADLKSTTSMVEQLLNRQGRDAQRLEAQMKRSAGEIGGAFRGLAASIAAAFSLSQIQQLADGYTRFTNQLKVTGLEGESLAGTQEKLFQIAQKYGTELESVGELYSRASQSSAELGASQGQLLSVTEAVSASLKISGISASQAQGALLQLGQALGSPRIQAEEFNSLLDTMQPLLREVAKRIDGTGGTIGGLTRKIKDLKGEGVSNVQFFRAINDSLAAMQATAASSTLTLGNSFTVLNNALGKYIGEADQSLSATEQLSGAIIMLSNNLDTIIPAFAAIVAIIGVQYVAAAARATAANIALAASATGSAASMGALGAASFALQARMAGAATSMQAAAFAARGLGGSLLALAGGPYGALIALGAGLAYVIATTDGAEDATAAYAKVQQEAKAQTEKSADAAERLASAHGKARLEALALAKAERELTKQKLASAQASLIQAEAELARAKVRAQESAKIASGGGPGEGIQGRVSTSQQRFNADRRAAGVADANAKAAESAVIALTSSLARINSAIDGAAPPAIAAVGDGKKDKPKPKQAPKDRTDELAARAAQDLYQLQIEELRAKSQITTDLDERADLERQILAMERDAREADIAAAVKSNDLTAKQATAQREILDKLYGKRDAENADGDILVQATRSLYGIQIERERRMQAEQDRADLAETEFRAESDALRNQYDLATTLDDRRRIALQILDAEDAYLRSKLEAVIANNDLTKAVQDQAKIELAALNASAGDRRNLVLQSNQGPLDRYIEGTRDTKTRVEEAMVRELQSVNDGITDALTKQLGIKNQFVKDLFSIFLDDVIFRPLAEALRNRQSGGGGFLSSLLNIGASLLGSGSGGGLSTGNSGSGLKAGFKFPGRASGGYVAPGQVVRVNEHKGTGVELLRMGSQGGTVIPLGQTNARAAQATSRQGPIEIRVYAEEGAMFIPRVEAISQGEAVKVTMAAAGPLTERAVNETMRRAGRPKI